jgi:hypothetical protein
MSDEESKEVNRGEMKWRKAEERKVISTELKRKKIKRKEVKTR